MHELKRSGYYAGMSGQSAFGTSIAGAMQSTQWITSSTTGGDIKISFPFSMRITT